MGGKVRATMRALFTCLLSLLPVVALGAEGMWTFDAVPTDRISRELGVTLTEAQLEKLRLGAARLGTGCSASFVSPEGLVLTNHHCVRSCISQLSGPRGDFLGQGFTAKTPREEMRCPAFDVQQLTGIADVTGKVKAATQGKSGDALVQAHRAVKAELEAPCSPDAANRCEVVTLYGGGRYHLYTYRRYTDVRLAWAPEFSMAAFGGDPDNFHFPRFGLDAALLRVWENGKPAKTPQALPWARSPLKGGDPTFVAGHPGGTERQVTVAELAFQRDVALPDTTLRLAEHRGLLLGYRDGHPEQQAVLDAKLRSVENGLKALRGRHRALGDPAFFARLVEREESLKQRVRVSPKLAAQTRDAWGDIDSALGRYRSFRTEHLLFAEAQAFPSELFLHARRLVRAAAEKQKPNGQRLAGYTDAALPALEARLSSSAPIRKDLETLDLAFGLRRMREQLGADHPTVRRILGKQSPEVLASRLVKATKLADPKARVALLQGGAKALAAANDPLLALAAEIDAEARALATRYEAEVHAPIEDASQRIAEARFAVEGTESYPDATFTLRLSYGNVEGWQEGKTAVAPLTTFAGAFERATGVAPFALPPTWRRAKSKLTLSTPLDVATTHDIIGGNSGSPLLNARGEVAGLIFDGNLHSLGGRYGYDAERNRAVAVHGDAILESLRKIYGAAHLADELVPPLSAKPGRP